MFNYVRLDRVRLPGPNKVRTAFLQVLHLSFVSHIIIYNFVSFGGDDKIQKLLNYSTR